MSRRKRRTKIVATLGPATESDEAIDSLIKAGVDVVRLNFSHGTPEEHQARADRIRRISQQNNRHLAILADLQGPKIRTEKFRDGSVELAVGPLRAESARRVRAHERPRVALEQHQRVAARTGRQRS